MTDCSYNELRGKRTLIAGDVDSGKTTLTRRLLMEALDSGDEVTVLDFAPPVKQVNGCKIGGRLADDYSRCRVLWSEDILTPRLSAETPEMLVEYVGINAGITRRLIDEYTEAPTKVLFINDVSISLQGGELETLLRAINCSETVILNGYMGSRFSSDLGTGVSMREQSLMEEFARSMDRVIRL